MKPLRWLVLLFPLSLPAQENDLDWQRQAVSRDFGALGSDSLPADQQRRFQQGEIAYFFADYARARELWLPLAEGGVAQAQVNLGWMSQMGAGVEVDYAEALRWYDLAAAQGHEIARNNLGVMYEKGQGVAVDLSQARKWYRLSAESGYRFAQHNLANLLARTEPAAARRWWQKAADQGVAAAAQALTEAQ